MLKKLNESWFPRLYLWAAKAKFPMGLLFAYCVFAYLILGALSGIDGIGVGFFMALQMVFACFFVGVLQQLVIPENNFTKPRYILWVISGTAIITAFALIFKWFEEMPGWCLFLFIFFVILALLALVYSYYLELKQETKLLNSQLEKFQKTITKGGEK